MSKTNTNPQNDPYGPVNGQNNEVTCNVCNSTYKEHELRFENRGNLYRWWCKHRNCYAANIGEDIQYTGN